MKTIDLNYCLVPKRIVVVTKMKKIISGNILVALLAILVSACEKESSPILTANNSAIEAMSFDKSELRVYFDNGPKDYGCAGTGGNCLPDIIVRPEKQLLSVIQNIENFTISKSTSNALQVIRNNFDLLAKIISTDVLNKVLSEELSLTVKGSLDSKDTIYFVYSKSGEIISVQPYRF